MAEINDGGAAFPGSPVDNLGMSLYNWYRGQAIKGSALQIRALLESGYTQTARECARDIAEAANLIADAMTKNQESKP